MNLSPLYFIERVWYLLTDRVPPGGWPWIYRGLHWLLVIAATVLLGWFSDAILLFLDPRSTGADAGGIQVIERYWCGWLFAACYAFVRTILFAIGLFSWRDESEFPDIDDAWDRALIALDRLGYDIRDMPVYAVLGATSSTETTLFASVGVEWKAVVPTPQEFPLSPLRCYLSEQACFLSLTDVGAFARQLVQPAHSAAIPSRDPVRGGPVIGNLAATQRPNPNPMSASSASPTLTPGQLSEMAAFKESRSATPHPVAAASSGPAMTLAPDFQRGFQQPSPVHPSGKPTSEHALPGALEQRQLALGRRRLKHFLRLLKEDRAPFCGINGALAAIPFRWSVTARSLELLRPLGDDLCGLQSQLQLQFPVVALQSDLEVLTELKPFLERAGRLEPQFEDKTRAGTRFPLGAVLDRPNCEWVVDKAVEWFRDWVFKLFSVTLEDPVRRETYSGLDDASNRDLYQMLCTLQNRRNTLWQQLELIFRQPNQETPLRLAGYYFAAKQPRRAFLRGVLERLEAEQNEVAYLPSSCRRDRRLRTWGTLLMLCGTALVALSVFLGWQLWNSGPSKSAGVGGGRPLFANLSPQADLRRSIVLSAGD